jgi:hypothetical protein
MTSQYISIFSEALSSMNKKARKLAKYLRKVRTYQKKKVERQCPTNQPPATPLQNPLPLNLSLEQFLSLPQKQTDVYHYSFSKLLALDLSQHNLALTSIMDSISKIYISMDKQETEIELLKIQSQFIGNPPIFKSGRKLILEGDLFRIADDGKEKQYKFHLFSDALIYSRMLTQDSYKFTRALKLSSSTLNDTPDR